jgi:hypothetical protein
MNTVSKCVPWLGCRLAKGEEFVTRIRAEASAAGFTPRDLALAFAAIGADEVGPAAHPIWKLAEGREQDWRNVAAVHALLKTSAESSPPRSPAARTEPPRASPKPDPAAIAAAFDAHYQRCQTNEFLQSQSGGITAAPVAPQIESGPQMFARRKREAKDYGSR